MQPAWARNALVILEQWGGKMSISSVGSQSLAAAVMESAAAGKRHTHRCNCEGAAAETPSNNEADGGLQASADRHHRVHGEGHDRHGRGFGFGHFAMGMGYFIQEQMRAARREVAGEQIGGAVTELAEKVSELIDGAGRQEELAGALESFGSAIQDVAVRFENGEIGRRRAMAGFSAAFEDVVDSVRSVTADGVPPIDAEVSVETDAAAVGELPAGEADAGMAGANSLVDSLGQAFNAFMQELRSGLAMLDGMRPFMSAENRDRITETFVDIYRELVGLDGGAADADPASGEVDQVA